MKHAVTVLLLLALSYFGWREWPRTMKVYRSDTHAQRIPLAEWKTADYKPTTYVYSVPCQPVFTIPACATGAGVTFSNVSITTIGSTMGANSTGGNTIRCVQ